MNPKKLKGIVLCAGRGGRLRPFTDERPKCLLSFSGKTILERCLDGLRKGGIGDIVLVVGYRREMVESFVAERGYPAVSFVVNEAYDHTNTAVSLNLAFKKISVDTDVIVVNGDVLFDPGILTDLVTLPVSHGAAIDADISLDGEEIKVVVRGGRIIRIGKELDPRECLGEAIGLYKIGRETVGDLIRIYDDLEARGETKHFFEKGFDLLQGNGRNDGMASFGVFLTEGRPWVEIDTVEDYRYAERDIAPRL